MKWELEEQCCEDGLVPLKMGGEAGRENVFRKY